MGVGKQAKGKQFFSKLSNVLQVTTGHLKGTPRRLLATRTGEEGTVPCGVLWAWMNFPPERHWDKGGARTVSTTEQLLRAEKQVPLPGRDAL